MAALQGVDGPPGTGSPRWGTAAVLPTPTLCEHTAEVLAELGVTAQEIDELTTGGACTRTR